MVDYCIMGTVALLFDGYKCSKQFPTFYLDSQVQGIVSVEHAVKIARDILNPHNLANIEVNATAVRL